MRWLGGLPVDRHRPEGFVEQIVVEQLALLQPQLGAMPGARGAGQLGVEHPQRQIGAASLAAISVDALRPAASSRKT